MLKKGLILIVTVIAIIAVISLPGPALDIDYEAIKTPAAQTLSGITTKSFVEENDNFVIGVHIPQCGDDNFDTTVNAMAHKAIGQFKKDIAARQASDEAGRNEVYVLHIDYTIFRHSEDLLSVVFDQRMVVSDSWQKSLFSTNFDLFRGKELTINDLFKENAAPINQIYRYAEPLMRGNLEQQSNYQANVFDAGIYPNAENYDVFAISQDGIIVYYDYGQLIDTANGYFSLVVPTSTFGDSILLTKDGLSRGYTVDPNKPMVALTFDDGPHSKFTPILLDGLKQRGARATFFILGNRAESLPSVIKREYEEGHSVQIHGYNHVGTYSSMSESELRSQISRTSKAVVAACGVAPTMVRPPYGAINNTAASIINMPLILWSIDPLDWKYRNASTVASNILNKVQDGDIILLHDIHETSVYAALNVIDSLKAKGYQFVTVEELFKYKGKTLQKCVTYTSAK